MFFGGVYIQKKVFYRILIYVEYLNTSTINKASKVGRTNYYAIKLSDRENERL